MPDAPYSQDYAQQTGAFFGQPNSKIHQVGSVTPGTTSVNILGGTGASSTTPSAAGASTQTASISPQSLATILQSLVPRTSAGNETAAAAAAPPAPSWSSFGFNFPFDPVTTREIGGQGTFGTASPTIYNLLSEGHNFGVSPAGFTSTGFPYYTPAGSEIFWKNTGYAPPSDPSGAPNQLNTINPNDVNTYKRGGFLGPRNSRNYNTSSGIAAGLGLGAAAIHSPLSPILGIAGGAIGFLGHLFGF